MVKKNCLLLVLISFLIGACSDIDVVIPKGDPGEKGLSAYEEWVGMVEKGVYPEWVDNTEKTDFMKFLTGRDGASAYDVWKDMISSGKVVDPHNPNQMWDPNKNSKENFFEYLTGAKGEPGLPGSNVTIDDKGYWVIDGEDTGVLARGQNGLSAYEIWSNKVKRGEMPDRSNPSKPWDSSKYTLQDFWEYFLGRSGKDGLTPEIGDNGNWWLGGKDTGVPAQGKDGLTPRVGTNGNWWIGDTDTKVPARGEDGTSPKIGDNGNWWIGSVDTGVPARGQDGDTPKIGDNGNWWIGNSDTGVPAKGNDGLTPHIGNNDNWWIGTIDTGVPARGQDGNTPRIGDNGNWWIGNSDTGVPAKGNDGLTPHVGNNGNWWIGDTDTTVPARGQDGQTPHIGDNGNWWIGDTDTKVPAKGADGETPYVGGNGNWWIGAVDSGVPAQGEDGVTPEIGDNGNWWIDGKDTGKPSQGEGVPGESAYELWKKEVAKGTLKNPHPDTPGYEGEFWNTAKTSLYDFWFYLRGRDGKDGKDGETEIIKGKPNVIVEFYNSKEKEYLDPKDGSATFVVYDADGIKAPAGSVVKGLPALDPDKSFTTDANGTIHVAWDLLPDKKPLEDRKGATLEVTINGVTSKSASNTLVPNRINTRIILKDVYLRPNSPWDWSRTTSVNDFTVIKFVYEREVDGIWTSRETYIDQNKIGVVHIKNINNPLQKDNLVENVDDMIANPDKYLKWGNGRGEGGTSSNPTTPFFDLNDGIFLVYRPIVLTNDEKTFNIEDGTRYPSDYRMDWILKQLETTRKYAWDGKDQYVTIIGLENYYGQHPIMDAKIHNPEIYPSPSLKNVTYKMNNGSSSLMGTFDSSTFGPVYIDYTTEGDVWKAVKFDTVPVGYGPGFQISMTKFTDNESGSTELSVKCTYDNLNFDLGSAYPNNVLTTRVFSYWNLPVAGQLGDCNSFYRLRPIFDFFNKGTSLNPKYVLKDIYGTKEYNVPIVK